MMEIELEFCLQLHLVQPVTRTQPQSQYRDLDGVGFGCLFTRSIAIAHRPCLCSVMDDVREKAVLPIVAWHAS